jgi:FtsP/CotA-like multicopper oxidase with cupredoxin domain
VKAQSAPVTVLQLKRRDIQVNGKPASVFGIMQPDGTHGLTTTVGQQFRVRLENHLDEPSLIHWHGLAPPWQQDGVPGISAPPIAPGSSADYDFALAYDGTFWMHSHQGLQEQLLMTAPLIIREQPGTTDEQEVVILLSDFSFTPPEQIFAGLRKPMMMSGMSGMAMGGAGAPDLNDVKYDAFLANDRTLAEPEIVPVEPGAKIKLRVINGASMSAFHLDLGQLDGMLTAVDGMPIVPVKGRRFPLAVAQRLDISLVMPRAPAAYPVLAILEGERRQTGIILRVGQAAVTRVADTARKASTALTLDLERQLRAAKPLQARKADRSYTLDLTGNMMNYVWSINNVVWNPDTPPLKLIKGERVELIMTNKTQMPHPMHLHGHTFQVVEIDGQRFPGALRDTVLVPPNRRVVVAFDANNPGHWVFHCHLLYHMEAGMFATFLYS